MRHGPGEGGGSGGAGLAGSGGIQHPRCLDATRPLPLAPLARPVLCSLSPPRGKAHQLATDMQQ